MKAPDGAIGMVHEDFSIKQVTIHRGQTLTFVNDSRYMHIIGPGRDGTLEDASGQAMDHRVLMQENATYTTPPFNVPGTYYVTCSMHSEMTVKVIVTN